MKEKKYFYFAVKIEERNGEQEYNFTYLVTVERTPRFKNVTQKRLDRIADQVARGWYDNDDKKPDMLDDYYEFNGGCLLAKATGISQITKEEYEIVNRIM